MTDSRHRIKSLSLRVQRLSVTLVAAEILLIGYVAAVLPTNTPSRIVVPCWLAVVWLLWIALLISNYRLIQYGDQRQRFHAAPVFVNRPELWVRACCHLTINWSAVITTLCTAWLTRPLLQAYNLRAALIVAILATLVLFNYLHRRKNRARNLVLTVGVASCLIVLTLWSW